MRVAGTDRSISFADLARAAHKPRPALGFSIFSGAQANLDTQLAQLRQKLGDLQTDMQSQAFQIDFWRRRATELAPALGATANVKYTLLRVPASFVLARCTPREGSVA